MDKASILFCTGTLAGALLLSVVGYSLAALPPGTAERARTAASPETLSDIDLGGGFGRVSALDLMGYWIEHPPHGSAAAPAASGAAQHFSGC